MNKLLLMVFVSVQGLTCYAQKDTIHDKYIYVDEMPQATYNVNEFIAKNLHYPDAAVKNNIEGRVTVRFVVTEKGTIDDAVAVGKRLGADLEEEAIRVIKSMPPWRPGKQNGKPVSVNYTLPVTFRLYDISSTPEKK